MSASVGLLFLASSAAAAMICPGWQYPHSGTSPSRHAIWSGCWALGEIPSIVVTSFPAAWLTGCTHERTALPFTCTVHAPHCAKPWTQSAAIPATMLRREIFLLSIDHTPVSRVERFNMGFAEQRRGLRRNHKLDHGTRGLRLFRLRR